MKTQAYLKNPSVLVEVGDDGTRKIIAIGGVPVDGGGGGGESVIVSTYEEVKTLRDNSELIPGCWYRITDYDFTCRIEGIISAHHAFDILVLATSESTLSEEARAIKHEGDTYFANSDLNAWKLWYSIDNKYWAASNGKGVIYRMIDERNNDVCCDFKNLYYYDCIKLHPDAEGYIFNMTDVENKDCSLYGFCACNCIEILYDDGIVFPLVQINLYNDTIICIRIKNSSNIYIIADNIYDVNIENCPKVRSFDYNLYIHNLTIFNISIDNLSDYDIDHNYGRLYISVDSDNNHRVWNPADPTGT